MDWTTIVSAVLGLVAVVFGGFWLKAKGKLSQVVILAKETHDLIDVAIGALEDNALDKTEVESIKKEALEVRDAWKVLIGK